MNLTLKYFASIRETMGCASEQRQTQAADVAALRDELIAQGGLHAQALARDKLVRVAVNQVMVSESGALTDGAEVAFFPPVTGG